MKQHSSTRQPRSSRIKDWKDWVDKSDSFEDCNGHGTHAVALAMKTAPAAEIFVARVAKNREDLQGASENIAKVSPSARLSISLRKRPADRFRGY